MRTPLVKDILQFLPNSRGRSEISVRTALLQLQVSVCQKALTKNTFYPSAVGADSGPSCKQACILLKTNANYYQVLYLLKLSYKCKPSITN